MTATVKICGVRDEDVLRAIRHLPIDHIGFMFAQSRRRIEPGKAGELIAALRDGAPAAPLAAGVFVNPTEEELGAVMAEAPLDIVQLHGRETPEFCRRVKERFRVLVFKSLSIADAAAEPKAAAHGATAITAAYSAAALPDAPANLSDTYTAGRAMSAYAGSADAILLDTYDPVAGGGTGRAFAWHCIPAYRDEAHRSGMQLIVAGGLDADNVRELLERYRPDGVDVSSGVETDGHKDIAKIEAFVGRVKTI